MLNFEKLSNLLLLLEDQNIHVACISETWFDSTTGKFSALIKERGFDIVHSPRKEKRGGGTAIIFKKNLKVKPREASSSRYQSFEFSSINLSCNSSKILLICLYRKQEVSCKTFCNELEEFMERIFDNNEELLVVGDFNVWAEVENDRDVKRLSSVMSAYGLTQIIEEPTHRSGHTLDHVYINEHSMTLEHLVHNETFGISTDHFPCTLRIPSSCQEDLKETISRRSLKNIDMDLFKTKINRIVEDVIATGDDFEDSYNDFRVSAEELLNELAPMITKTVSRKTGPKWVDAEYKSERAKRRKLEKLWRKSKSEKDHKEYIAQRNICAQLSLSKQERYFSNVVESSCDKQKSLFRVVNEVLDKKADRVLPAHDDPKTLANEFNEYYINKIEKIRKSIPETHDANLDEKVPFKGKKLDCFRPVSSEEVLKVIKDFGVKTSCEDPIPAALISSAMNELLPLYVDLVNKSLAEGTMEGIAHSEIDPLLKKTGLDPDNKKNYRPVNNLVFLSKLTERIVSKQIDEHMETNDLFTNEFFGYKKHHSTETMMIGMTDEILTGFDEDKCTIMLFLDLSAAFDTIDIDRMVEILAVEIGLSGTALDWCKSFLSNRTQRVKIKGQYSEKLYIKYGTVQGSVLGPKFFNIYVRSQPRIFRQCGFNTTAFADDSNGRKTFSISFQYNVLVYDVKDCIEQITKWSYIQCLKINPDKTEMILFHPKSMEHQIIIGGTIVGDDCIRYSKEVKNVGVWLDQHMTMNKHVNSLVSHCYHLLKNIGRIRSILSSKHAEILVHAVISSRLDNCNSLLMNASKSNLHKLQKVQNAAARLVVRGRRRTPISDTLRKLHWLRVESRIVYKILLLVFKSLHGQCSKNLGVKFKSFNGRPLLETKAVNTKYGKRTFSYTGPKLWNALPLDIREENNIEKFKQKVKTLLFEGTVKFLEHAFIAT